jgi:acid phosphatase type 7
VAAVRYLPRWFCDKIDGMRGPVVLLAALGALAPACGDDIRAIDEGPSVSGAGIPSYDGKAQIIRGPYLQVPTQTSMTIVWATDLPATTRVEYGVDPSYGRTASGRTYRYGYGIDSPPPNGWLHEVTLTGLDPSTTYLYRVVSIKHPTENLFFRTAPTPGETFRAAIYGDTRTDLTVHAATVDAIYHRTPDLLLFTGDFVNTGGNDSEWNTWFGLEAPIISRIPFLPVIGNHELGVYNGGAHYDQSFVGPETALIDFYGEKSARMYSLDYGSLHVTAVDAYAPLDDLIEFLDADLASPAAVAAKFRLILMHPPVYTFSYHRAEGLLRDVVMPRARAGGVQVIATGHNHIYERFWLGDIHQVVSGGGGGPLHELNTSTGPSGRLPDDPSLRVAGYKEHTFVIADFAGDLATFRTLRTDGTELDCFRVDATQQPPENLGCL